MKLIRVTDNDRTVVAEIRVTGLVVWNYEYAVDDYTIAKKGTDDKPRKHALGLPEELDGDPSAWIFTVFNPGRTESRFDTVIRWLQAGKQISAWSGRGTVKAGKIARKSGEAMFVVGKGGGA